VMTGPAAAALPAPALRPTRKRIWLLSDPHLNHANILSFRGNDGALIRPGFANVREMNERILEGWNSRVRHRDIGYWLGDMVIGDLPGFAKLWPKFNGSKRLIIGNHDDPKFLSSGGFFKKTGVERKFGEYGIFLSHRPAHESGLELNGQIMLNVHGHIHEKPSPPGPFRNVSVEVMNYEPIEIEELIAEREAVYGPWRDRAGNVRARGVIRENADA
jgi:calcineurin-like phosphoesterase family protein